MFKNFIASESGAVTVDWVVLTAALVGLGLAVMAMVSGGSEDFFRCILVGVFDHSPVRISALTQFRERRAKLLPCQPV